MGYATCCGPWSAGVVRRHWTREERAQRLEAYADSLENELKAVKERIETLRDEE